MIYRGILNLYKYNYLNNKKKKVKKTTTKIQNTVVILDMTWTQFVQVLVSFYIQSNDQLINKKTTNSEQCVCVWERDLSESQYCSWFQSGSGLQKTSHEIGSLSLSIYLKASQTDLQITHFPFQASRGLF